MPPLLDSTAASHAHSGRAEQLWDWLDSHGNAIDLQDEDGLTLLHHAAVAGQNTIVEGLLERGADHRVRGNHGFTPLDDAVEAGQRDVVASIVSHLYRKNLALFLARVPSLCEQLASLPDCIIELKWEFRTWVPLLTRFCPSDTYRIYKKGSKVRCDITLVGFERLRWVRGDVSFLFRPTESSVVVAVDRKEGVWGDVLEPVATLTRKDALEEADELLRSGAMRGDMDSRGVTWVRRTGYWSGRDVDEDVQGHTCHVYECRGLGLGVRWRSRPKVEDSESDESGGEDDEEEEMVDMEEVRRALESTPPPPEPEEEEEFFDAAETPWPQGTEDLEDDSDDDVFVDAEENPEGEGKIGQYTREVKFNLWMAPSYPVSLGDFLPLIEVLAPTSKHFSKLRDFLALRLPPGFPVKIEVPVFPSLTAVVTCASFTVGCEHDGAFFDVPQDYVYKRIDEEERKKRRRRRRRRRK